MIRRIVPVFLVLLTFTLTAQAQDQGVPGSLEVLTFGDYYWVASNHNEDLEGKNGFWLRRIYFTYDVEEFVDNFSARVRLEMDSPGDFTTSVKLSPVVKDAYLSWQPNAHEFTLGISGTPTWDLVEDVWGYRFIEKSPLDLHDLGSSREFGISAAGPLTANGSLQYNFMLGNGSSNKAEINKGKKVMGALSYQITERLVVQAYSDWDDMPGNSDWITAQGFAGYVTKQFRLGALYARQIRQQGNEDLELDLASLFGVVNLSESVAVFGRVDRMFDPNPQGEDIDYIPFSSQAEPTFLLGGADIAVNESIRFAPNVETIFYGETPTGTSPDTDVIPRLTFFYQF